LYETEYLEDLEVDGRIILKMILEEKGWKAWTEFIWLGTGTSSKLL
jgi:hypothetical protein